HGLAAHRDLKPENILLDDLGDPILCDYGLAFPLEGMDDVERISDTLEQIGSRHYMAPEALSGAKRLDLPVALDIYAFGKIAYEIAAGVVLPGLALPIGEWDLAPKHPGPQQDAWFSFNCMVADLVAHDPWDRMMAWKKTEESLALVERLLAAPLGRTDPDRVEAVVRRAMGTKQHIVEAREKRARLKDASAYGEKISQCIEEAFSDNPTVLRLVGVCSGDEPPIAISCGTSLSTTWPREMGLADPNSIPVTGGCPNITATCVSLSEPMVRLVAYIHKDSDNTIAVSLSLVLADYNEGWKLRGSPVAHESITAIPVGEMVSLSRIKELAGEMAERWVELFVDTIECEMLMDP
ncbi:MAG TPA: protein kinase, partial [Symbiobacteriaceae bacterium]|nr:protein kinase [Symbiobacteriaceae bacterium]